MGKIVKFCSECEEGFAEKFGFCPNCGHSLEAFEMNPLQKENIKAEAKQTEIAQPETPSIISSKETVKEEKIVEESKFANDFSDDNDVLELNVEGENKEEIIYEPKTEAEVYTPAATVFSSNKTPKRVNDFQTFANADVIDDDDDGFHVTVIEEKNVKQRNSLLLGSLAMMVIVLFGGFVYSLFAKDFDLGAIGSNDPLAFINDVQPVEIEVDEPPKPADDESGGGGGGGRDEEEQAQKGRMATQMREDPIIRPDKNIVQKDFELKQPIATTVGDKKIKPTEDQYGLENSTVAFGGGRGKGGGMGEGEGGGQGGGRGRGAGNGEGEGFGDGRGNNIGDGEDGGGNRPRVTEPREPPSSGPSKDLQITFKPKPRYTDEARQNNITGNVRVKVTFLANGAIGSVSPVSNLGYGLTEQAISAAKQMRFEPRMVNGKAVAVTKVVVFNFTIY